MFSAPVPNQVTNSPLALRAKLSFIVLMVMAAVMLPFAWFTVRDLEHAATEDAVSQIRASNQMLHNMIAANQDGLKIALLRLGTVFRHYYPGTFSLDETRSVQIGGVRAPLLKLNGKPLSLDQHIVNQFRNETGGGVATVFVRVGDDFLRIATSLTGEDGKPAIGTLLGRDHPGYAKLLAGQAFQGPARLFGRQYMTEYMPLLDASRRVIGLLFVGQDLTESIASLLDKVRRLSIGKKGYAFVINTTKGSDYGQFVAHPAKEGKNAGEQGQAIRDMLTRREGIVFYNWRNEELGDSAVRQKLAAFSEYRDLDWIVVTSAYLDEFVKLSHDSRDRMILAMIAVSLLAVLALNIALGRWVMTPMLRLQDRLGGAERTLRTLINALPDIVCFKDGEGRWLEANDVALERFQLQGVAYRGKRGSELPVTANSYRAAFLACEANDEFIWRTGSLNVMEETIPAPDGLPRVVEVTRVPLFHADGRRKGLLMVGRDITERKQTETRQRLAARIFETTGEAVMVTDTDANIVLVNPAFCRITGYSAAEVLGKNPRLLNSEQHEPAFHQAMWQSLQASGNWSGEVWNRRKSGEIFPEWETVSSVTDESGKIRHYVAVFADLSEIRHARAAAEQLSWRDSLTGLANRALFLKRLEQTLDNTQRQGRFADVLLLDLDRFKDINEARGLAVGDALLKAVAERLGQVLHSDDVLARLDSDEFAVLLPRPAMSWDAAGREALAVAEKLRTALRESITLDGESMHLDASIGIAMFPDRAAETASDVLRQADMAMHRAKDEGGSRAVFFETGMGETVRERYELESELRHAIDNKQLRLYLQPQVDAGARQVGAEALVRWQHPERGLVAPGAFIPLAEASDLIVAIDRWMLGEVCRLLARLEQTGHTLRIAVNVSPRHFSRPDFVEEVKRQLAASGAEPTRLVLEVTEGLVIGDVADVVAKMTALTALGLHFSMDDFGTGYSSLSYLKRLPIHELKIDKSFIDDVPNDLNDVALVETILAVAQHLHLQVVAEGVETEAQAAFLKARGNVIYQGYLYGRPQPVETWLARLPPAEELAPAYI